ncbi:hypothetical protein fugu_006056 [Takifugu bimaculatus]|uniref:Groucho/TLE N-terminal Q-rich domain-containing protein n=1 Tax=Takifugu bimaculatus TaxID=433685 RepID=A0A4Z2B712_9TELE|nr:hypothetical protein fugu_006056 [Takifugu bimaculatus]
MYPQGRHPVPLQPGQSFKFTVLETLDRIKEEFQFLQAQYHSLKLECEKLASEKTEMQRHYIMSLLENIVTEGGGSEVARLSSSLAPCDAPS